MESAAARKRAQGFAGARDDKVGGEKKLKFRNYAAVEELAAPTSRRLPGLRHRRRRLLRRTMNTPAAPAPRQRGRGAQSHSSG